MHLTSALNVKNVSLYSPIRGDLVPLLDQLSCTNCIALCSPKFVLCNECQQGSISRRKGRTRDEIGMKTNTWSNTRKKHIV
eukprot:6173321-Pleurochrysis_carterae.AAC.3